MVNERLSDRLLVIRKAHGLTQEQAGKRAGMTARSILNYEAGTRTPSLHALQRLAKTYGVDVGVLAALDVPRRGK
jgi:transcriptional regulator with XRE-family HTH domain